MTDFENELEEVGEPVFVRDIPIQVHLDIREAAAVQHMAEDKGISQEELIRAWVLQKLARRNSGSAKGST